MIAGMLGIDADRYRWLNCLVTGGVGTRISTGISTEVFALLLAVGNHAKAAAPVRV